MKKQFYGVSSKFNFGRWDHVVYKFQNEEQEEEWLYTEEYDFRERESCSKTRAIEIAGRKAVENAIDYAEIIAEREKYEQEMHEQEMHEKQNPIAKHRRTESPCV